MTTSIHIGIPKEIKPQEGRIALLPAACKILIKQGHSVAVQQGAGTAAGYSDEDYAQLGVKILADAATLYQRSAVIVKVKEPIGAELDYLDETHSLFSFLHLAANKNLAQQLRDSGVTAFAYETLQVDGHTPILAPMSEVAGKISVQVGTTLLHGTHGGKGILLGGVAGSDPGNVLVIGAGSVGMSAAGVAHGLGATVTVLDISEARLDTLRSQHPNIHFQLSSQAALEDLLPSTDLLVGAVMVAGRHAPTVVTRQQVAMMQPGSVIADVAIDQGGCVETSQPVSWEEPTYRAEDVLHFSVTNMPGAVPRTASQALSAQILPHLVRFLEGDWQTDAALQSGLNISTGEYVNEAVAAEMKAEN